MALIPCPACGRQVSEVAVACPACGHPIAGAPKGAGAGTGAERGDGRGSGSFKEALTRPETVRQGVTVLGVFIAAPWIARVIAVLAFVALARFVVWQKT